MSKKRLDVLLTERGLFESRQKAQSEILAGNVLVNEEVITKCGYAVADQATIRVKEKFPYVSRGALKLIHALDSFDVDPQGKIAVDVGSSTGGFSEVLLERGAVQVYAVDVGTNQLAWKLRNDPRVSVMEKTNARAIDEIRFDPPPQIATMDVSFISVTRILEPLLRIMTPQCVIVVLIKPQFELEPEMISDGGFVPEKYRAIAVERVIRFACDLGLEISEVIESPIAGAKSGNVEFLTALYRGRGKG